MANKFGSILEGFVLDPLKNVGSAAVRAGSAAATAAGLTQESFERAGNVVANTFGKDGKAFDEDATSIRSIATSLAEKADAMRNSTSEQTRQAQAGSQLQGNLFKGEAHFDEGASARGIVNNIAEGLGSVVPSVALGYLTKGGSARTQTAVGGVAGAAMGGGAGAQEEGARVRDMDEAGLSALPAYQEALATGLAPAAAREAVARKAELGAFAATAPVSALGGAATSALFGHKAQGLLARAVGGGKVGQTVASGLVGAAEEGIQEVSEGVAQRVGASQATGEQGRELGEESASNAFLGVAGGGFAGGGAALADAAAPQNVKPPSEAPTVVDPNRGVLSRSVAAGAREGNVLGVQVEGEPEFLGSMEAGQPPLLPPPGPEASQEVRDFGLQTSAARAARGLPYIGGTPERTFEIKPFPGLSTSERKIEAKAAQQVLADPQAAIEAYRKIKGTDGGRIINTDEAREIFDDYNYGPEGRSKNAVAVHEPSSFLSKLVFEENLAADVSEDRAPLVLFTAGGTGAGKTTAIQRDEGAQAMYEAADIIYDGNLQNVKGAVEKIDQSLASGRAVSILYVHRDPIEAFTQGAIKRANNPKNGRTVPIPVHAGTHIGAAKTILELAELYKDHPDVTVQTLNNAGDEIDVTAAVSGVASTAYTDLEGALRNAADQTQQAGGMQDRVGQFYFPERYGGGTQQGQAGDLQRQGAFGTGQETGRAAAEEGPGSQPGQEFLARNEAVEAPLASRNLSRTGSVPRETSEFGIIVAPKPGTKVTGPDGQVRPYQRDVDGGNLPPAAAPVQREPDLVQLQQRSAAIFKRPAAVTALRKAFGVKGLKIKTIRGSYEGAPELSFTLAAEGLDEKNATQIANFLGMAFSQDAVIVTKPTPAGPTEDSIPTLELYNTNDTKLNDETFALVAAALRAEGIDYSEARDGKAIRVLHFGDEAGLESLATSMAGIAAQSGLAINTLHTRSDLHEAADYRRNLGQGGDQALPGQRPEVFRALVDQFLVPHTRAIGAAGYRFDADRYAERFGLDDTERAYLTAKLAAVEPRSTVPLLTGEEKLPTKAGRSTNIDAAWFLQNRAASLGEIKASDRSKAALDAISETFAQEIEYQVNKPEGKNAIGWYDRQLRNAMETMAEAHPEIATDPNAEFVMKALMAVTSQGLTVEQNFNLALKLYQRYRDTGTINLDGITMVGKAAPVAKKNVEKLASLIKGKGLAGARDWMRAMHTIRELKAAGFKDVTGRMDETVRGWHAFGPKIGSFGNNLDGDFDTLTADLWFSRTWNRTLGTMFQYSASREANTIREFRPAMVDALNNPGTNEVIDSLTPEERAQLGNLEFDLELAKRINRAFARGGYKDKTPLTRAAKAWSENVDGLQDVPRGDPERRWQDEVMRETQHKLEERTGQKIAIADLQALLWYQEKELFRILGAANKSSAPLDYQDAAKNAITQVEGASLASQAPPATVVETAYPLGTVFLMEKIRSIVKDARISVIAGTGKAASRVAIDREITPAEAKKIGSISGIKRVTSGTFPAAPQLEPESGERAVPVRFQVPASVTNAKDFAALEPEQETMVDGAIAQLKGAGYPSSWLKKPTYYFAHNHQATNVARFYLDGERKGAVSLRQDRFKSAANVKRELAHELAHAADFDADAEAFYSATSPRLAMTFSKDGAATYQGDIARELYRAWASDSPLTAELDYPFLTAEDDGRPNVIKAEMFAQAVMLYMTQRADLARNAPTTHAMIKEMFENENRSDGRSNAALQGALQTTGSGKLGARTVARETGAADRVVDSGERDRSTVGRGGQRPGGKPAVEQTETAAFKKWFGDSKVVNEDGTPRVMYHGSTKNFDAFQSGHGSVVDIGFHFGNQDQAVDATADRAFWLKLKNGYVPDDNFILRKSTGAHGNQLVAPNASIAPVFVSIKNPITIEDTDNTAFPSAFARELADLGIITSKEAATIPYNGAEGSPLLRAMLQEKGYDGLRYINKYEGEIEAESWVAFEPTQIKSAIANNGDFDANNPSTLASIAPSAQTFNGYTIPSWQMGDHLSSEAGKRVEGYKGAVKAGGEKLRTYLQDYFLPVRRVQEAITARGGTITEETDVYGREEVYYGRTGEQLRKLEDDHVKPLVKAMVDSGVKQEDLELYLYAKFAPARNARIAEINPKFPDGGSGMTNDDAAQVLADFDTAGQTASLEALAKRVRVMNDQRIDILEEAGLLSSGEADLWREEKDYVPLKGFAEGIGDPSDATRMPTGKGFSIGGKEAHKALGRKSRASDLIANTIAQVEQAIIRAEKNRVATALLRLAEENPNPSLWTVDKVPEKPQLSAAGEVTYRKDNRHTLADNVVSVKIAGEQHFITLNDPRLAASMKNLGAAKMGAFLRGFSAVNRFLSLTRTMLAPEFVLANFSRDLQTAAINLTGDESASMAARVVKDVPVAIRAMYGQLRGKSKGGEWSRWAQEFADEGGMTSFVAQYTVEEQQAKIKGLLADASGGKVNAIKQLARGTLEMIEDVNGAVENATRLAAYAAARRQGQSKQQAARLAKNLTVNFNRKGQAGPTLNALYLFYNASVQGTARFLHAMKSPKVQKIMAATAVLGYGLAALNRAAGGEDDDGEDKWDKIPEWEKARNLIIFLPGGDGAMVKIPLPYSYNLPFLIGSQVEAMANSRKPASDAAATIAEAILTSFNPIGDLDLKGDSATALAKVLSPTVADPLVDIAVNRNFFGAPINPETNPFDKVKDPDSQNAFPSANPVARWIANTLNTATGGDALRPGLIDVSPGSMVYVFDYLTGGTGGFVERAVGAVALAAKGEEVPVRTIPFARVYAGSLDERRVTDTFYRLRDDVNLKAEMARTGVYDTPGERREAALGRRMAGQLKGTERQLRALRDQRKLALGKGDEARVKVLKEKERAVQLRFNKAYFTAMDALAD